MKNKQKDYKKKYLKYENLLKIYKELTAIERLIAESIHDVKYNDNLRRDIRRAMVSTVEIILRDTE